MQTVIFVDVDGVLNVGARDGGGPLLINKVNIGRAQSVMRARARSEDGACLQRDPEDCLVDKESQCAQKILAVSEYPEGRRDKGTLSMLAAGEFGFSDILVSRLAALIASTTPEPKVVLASSWRQTRFRSRAETLRRAIQQKLGHEFRWSGMTAEKEECTAGDRLRCIGEYLEEMELPSMVETRLLVLDDFFITPFDGWNIDGVRIECPEDAEDYLLRHCQSLGTVAVKVVHPYEEFIAGRDSRGRDIHVKAAVGLTEKHFNAAADFLLRGGGTKRGPANMSRRLIASVSSGRLLKVSTGMMARIRCDSSNCKVRAATPTGTPPSTPDGAKQKSLPKRLKSLSRAKWATI